MRMRAFAERLRNEPRHGREASLPASRALLLGYLAKDIGLAQLPCVALFARSTSLARVASLIVAIASAFSGPRALGLLPMLLECYLRLYRIV